MNRKTAVVTGASRGIGRAIARRLAEDGYFIIGVYHRTAPAAEEPGFRWIQCDFADPAQVQTLCSQLAHEAVDLLVNNAGISCTELFQCVSPAQADALYQINLRTPVELCRALLPQMLHRQSGVIINIASVWGETGASCEVDYSAAKGGLIAFTKALAKEAAPMGVRVNAISPGTIQTDMTAPLGEETLAGLREEIPLGRLGTAQDIAQTAAFLASDHAAYITGQDIAVNGGWYC